MIKDNDLVNEFEVMLEQSEWSSALFSIIKSELSAGRTYQAQQLANIGQYLAEEAQHHQLERLETFK